MERRDTLTDTFSDEIGLAIPNINALDDICDAMEICDENNIPYDGLDDIEDFKDRIRLHFIKSKRVESRKTEVRFFFLSAMFIHPYPPTLPHPHPHLTLPSNLNYVYFKRRDTTSGELTLTRKHLPPFSLGVTLKEIYCKICLNLKKCFKLKPFDGISIKFAYYYYYYLFIYFIYLFFSWYTLGLLLSFFSIWVTDTLSGEETLSKYSRTSLSRTRLFRITAYLEVKIWSLF